MSIITSRCSTFLVGCIIGVSDMLHNNSFGLPFNTKNLIVNWFLYIKIKVKSSRDPEAPHKKKPRLVALFGFGNKIKQGEGFPKRKHVD